MSIDAALSRIGAALDTISATRDRLIAERAALIAQLGQVVWTFADGEALRTGPGQTTRLATVVPAGAIVTASPDLLPGQTLQHLDGVLSIVGDATVPAVDVSTLIRPGGHVIEVMESPISPLIVNVTKGIEYPSGKTWPSYEQPPNRWNAVMWQASPGDVIEVAPGSIHESQAGLSNYWANNLNPTTLALWKPVTIRNMAGRGRWRPWHGDEYRQTGASGVCIFAPIHIGGRGAITLEGFQFDNWGWDGGSCGVRIMSGGEPSSDPWAGLHAAVTLRNFKIGKPPYERSASGINGGAETLLIEDGHIYDTGAGIYAPDGNDHNAYVSARTMTIRGVRFQRSRGLTPNAAPDTDMDGHMLKASAVNALIEGCCFDADPQWGDNTHHIQAKAGGNFVIRSSLFVGSARTEGWGRGAINMCREGAANPRPNFEPWAGQEGNSLLVEKNIFIEQLGRAAVWFFEPGHGNNVGLDMSAVTVRDNIAMIPNVPTRTPGFPGAGNALYIANDPLNGPDWAARGNAVEPWSADEAPFGERALKLYRRVAGPLAAVGGEVLTKRFVWPHGCVDRRDAFKGLA